MHALLSLHKLLLGINWHCPFAGLQESVVQAILSLHVIVVPPQIPLLQESPVVHKLLSLQLIPLLNVGLLHIPLAVLQLSVVHILLSLH